MKKKTDNSTKPELIHLFISLPTGDVCSLRDISTKLLVHQIKSRIELRVGIPGDIIHLYFMNSELADEKLLDDYKLKHGCILRVRLHKTWLGLFLACSKGDAYEVFQNGVQTINAESSSDFDVELWNKLVIKRATFALFMATYHGFLSLMLELLNSSAADINGCTIFGRTALHIASFQGFVGCVSLLLSEGSHSSTLDVFGKTPLQLAHINSHIYCQKRLYMHQTSAGSEDIKNRDKAGVNCPKTAPHKLLKNFKENQKKKTMSSSGMSGVRIASSQVCTFILYRMYIEHGLELSSSSTQFLFTFEKEMNCLDNSYTKSISLSILLMQSNLNPGFRLTESCEGFYAKPSLSRFINTIL